MRAGAHWTSLARNHWSDAQPGIYAASSHIGERFKSPLGHYIYPGQRPVAHDHPGPCYL